MSLQILLLKSSMTHLKYHYLLSRSDELRKTQWTSLLWNGAKMQQIRKISILVSFTQRITQVFRLRGRGHLLRHPSLRQPCSSSCPWACVPCTWAGLPLAGASIPCPKKFLSRISHLATSPARTTTFGNIANVNFLSWNCLSSFCCVYTSRFDALIYI